MAQVDVLQGTEDSLLHSDTSFEEMGIPEHYLRALREMHIRKPSRIQGAALPVLLSNPPQNLIAQSQSGTGKTICFCLGMLMRVNPSIHKVQALCVCNTRELARQIFGVLQKLTAFFPVDMMEVLPGVDDKMTVNCPVVVGTPGKILRMVERRKLDLSRLQVFVLDEADKMVEENAGFLSEMRKLKSKMPQEVQVLLFSATYEVEVRIAASEICPNAQVFRVESNQVALDAIKQCRLLCKDADEKLESLVNLFGILPTGQTIIFCESRASARQLAAVLRERGQAVSLLHGTDKEGMTEGDRDRVVDEFKKGNTTILITTNVLSRGFDVLSVSNVINYTVPTNQDGSVDIPSYVHRIGRCGRFGRTGVSITFELPRETKLTDYIEQRLDRPIIKLDPSDWEAMEKVIEPPSIMVLPSRAEAEASKVASSASS